MTQVVDLYEPILSEMIFGFEDLPPEEFKPLVGTIMVCVPPAVERTQGGVEIPQIAQKRPAIAKVVAVPDDPECPVSPGDWVLYRQSQVMDLPFMGRSDLGYLQYCDGPASEIFGYFSQNTMEQVLSKHTVS